MMAIYHRRLLLPLRKPETDNSSCYMCYVCPDYCSNIDNSPIFPPPPPAPAPSSSHGHQVSTILVAMLCVLGLALMFLCYLTIRGYRIRSRRNASNNNIPPWDHFRDDENQGPVLDHPIWYIRTVGFPQSVIDTIAVFKHKKGEGLIEGSDCSICLNEFSEDESLRLLPKCSHAFHLPCIDTWLRSHKNCPVCRAPVLNINNNTAAVNTVSTNTSNRGSGVIDDRIHDNVEGGGDHRRNGLEEYSHDRPARETANLSDHGVNVVLRIEEDGTTLKNRVLSDLADHHRLRRVQANQESSQYLRRSVSMDFFSNIQTIHRPMDHSNYCIKQDEGCSDDFAKLGVLIVEKQHNFDMKRLNSTKKSSLINCCSSHGLPIQKGPILMKRSYSFSGRRSLWRQSRSVESISIPEV